MCVTIVKVCGRVDGMKISNVEIARCGLCTEGAVRAAVSTKRLDVEDAESVFGFILGMRVKVAGLGFMDGLERIKTGAEVSVGVEGRLYGVLPEVITGTSKEEELGYEPDESQREGNW